MKTIHKEIVNEYLVITLNRPDQKNAFDQVMISELTELFSSITSDQKIQGIILKGAGTVFCSGADLSWMKSMINYTYEENLKDSEKLWNLFDSIQKCPFVVVADVHGAVFGGALGLIACCDYVFAEEKTKFCFSEVKLGLAPAVISSFILNKCSEAFIRPLMLSAEVFNIQVALQAGLVQKIVQNKISISDIQSQFSSNGVEAMKATKKLINDLKTQKDHKKLTTELISHLRTSQEAQIRLGHFLNKK